MKTSLWCVLFFSLFSSANSADRPNIVMLLADDLGYQDIGCYSGPVKTPTLDQLAKGGTRFTNFYSGCAVCSPSRATLLTGRHHIRTGVYSWIHDESQHSHLLEREVTLAEILGEAGYETAQIGKWHLGLPTETRRKPTPADHGFDHWFATWNNASPSHRNPTNFIRNGSPVGPLQGYACQLVVDEALSWVESREGGKAPFFLNVWFHEPHAPIAAPSEIVAEYGDEEDKAAIYSGTIANTDRAIGRLISRVRRLSDPSNTLIIYASDNGSYRDDRTGGLRGRKGMNWEGGIRVPGMFHWPGRIEEGVEREEPAGLVDVLPTICGLLDLSVTSGRHIDGSDLSPLLTGYEPSFTRHQPLFWHLQKSRPVVAMRDGAYSLTADPAYELSRNNMFQEAWIPVIKSGDYTNFQLFNLELDPKQTKNLAAIQPERLEKMKLQLLEINASVMSEGEDWHLR